jgi:hypothetical protein
MQGDFTRMEMFTNYYESLQDLMDVISPSYRERFADDFGRRFELLKDGIQHVRLHLKFECHSYSYNLKKLTFPLLLQDYRHSNSSGPMSDYSEEGEDCITTASNSSGCAFCRKRPSTEVNCNDGVANPDDETPKQLNRTALANGEDVDNGDHSLKFLSKN